MNQSRNRNVEQVRAARLPAEQNAALKARMGRAQAPTGPTWEGSSRVFHQMSQKDAIRFCAARNIPVDVNCGCIPIDGPGDRVIGGGR